MSIEDLNGVDLLSLPQEEVERLLNEYGSLVTRNLVSKLKTIKLGREIAMQSEDDRIFVQKLLETRDWIFRIDEK